MEFLLERYEPGLDARTAEQEGRALRRAARELRSEGLDVRVVRRTYVPSDEALLWLVRAPSAAVALSAGARAGLRIDRVVETGAAA